MPTTSPEAPLRTTWLLPDGRAGGRTDDGRTVRIAGAVPGDLVAYVPTGGTGRTVDAVVGEILEPSPDRRAPVCPHSATCGGCDLDGFAASARAEALTAMVARSFRWEQPIPFVPSPRPIGHRARIKLAIEGGRLGYRAARSHDLVPIDVCRVARPEIAVAHATLQAWLDADPSRTRGLVGVELRSDGERVVYAFESDGKSDPKTLSQLGDVAVDGRRISGDPVLELQGDGVRLRASPASFYQVNLENNLALVAHVREIVTERRSERVLDLYAGIGNIGLAIAAAGTPVVAVESPGPGAEDLRFNASPFPGTEILAVKAEKFEPSRVAFDAVVLDPPRSGAAGVLGRVARNRPKTVVYVSCFAPNAARDLGELKGYTLRSLTAFDLFPDTHHVEVVAVLERG